MCEQQPNDDVCVCFYVCSLCNRKNFTICFDYEVGFKPEADGEYLKVFHCVCAKYWRRKTLKKRKKKTTTTHPFCAFFHLYLFFHISVFAFFGPIFFSFFGEVVDSTSFSLLPVLKKKIASQNKEETKLGAKWMLDNCEATPTSLRRRRKKKRNEILGLLLLLLYVPFTFGLSTHQFFR